MARRAKLKCPFCNGEITGQDWSCPHCKAGEGGLTESQEMALRNGAARYTRTASIIVLIGGVSFVIGIAGVFINIIMTILGFVLWAICLVMVLRLIFKARYLNVLASAWGREDDHKPKAMEQDR